MEDERSEEVGRRSPEVVTGLVVIKAYVGAKTGELDKPSCRGESETGTVQAVAGVNAVAGVKRVAAVPAELMIKVDSALLWAGWCGLIIRVAGWAGTESVVDLARGTKVVRVGGASTIDSGSE